MIVAASAALGAFLAHAAAQAPALPPAGSPALVRLVELSFPAQGNVSLIDPETYLYYIHTRPSRPSEGVWTPYDQQTVLEDFRRLWASGFLDDLSVDVTDVPYANGVVGKHVTFVIEERQRIKIVDYVGSKAIEVSKIDEKLRDEKVHIRLDSFIDAAVVRKVEGLVRDMLREKGFQFANVTHEIAELPSGPKLVHLTFKLDEGPKVKIRRLDFVGNKAAGDRALKRQMKDTRQRSWLSFLTGRGTYQEAKVEADLDKVLGYYRDRGYIKASVGQPELKFLEDSSDRKTRWAELRIPVAEGDRYTVAAFAFEGNTVVKSELLTPMFGVRRGDFYNEKLIRKGLDKARDAYGAGGYFEFTAYPDLTPRDPAGANGPPTVDVTMRVAEGQQYFINRIAFLGNTTTHDNVIRRELRVAEGGVLNTEALKSSIRRLNQLGYFKPLENGKDVNVEKGTGAPNTVDVTLNVREQNRNQLTFGAGASQYEGVFGNLSYTTANFLGRGESLTLSAQVGVRAKSYQVGFTKPFLFERPISGGVNLFSNKIDYYTTAAQIGYSEVREGVTLTGGRPLGQFAQAFFGYAYEVIDVAVRDELLAGGSSGDAGIPLFNPYLDPGQHIESRISPSVVRNTVDNPLMPHRGLKVSGVFHVAGGPLRGTTDYIKPEAEMVLYVPTSRRTAFGVRGQIGWLRPFGATDLLPYYLRFFLGGENQIRGVDIRTVGPVDSGNRALGGNKFVLFNAEYYLDIAGPVRLLAFHDAGQAFAEGRYLDLRQMRTSSGAELRVIVPMLNVPFRLIWAWNVYRDSFQPGRAFKFAVGTAF